MEASKTTQEQIRTVQQANVSLSGRASETFVVTPHLPRSLQLVFLVCMEKIGRGRSHGNESSPPLHFGCRLNSALWRSTTTKH